MTLNQLYYFSTVAELQNYRRAAEKLYISQPSLSRSIASLEEELGVDLFEKDGRGVVLTKGGQLFLDHVTQILHDCEKATNKMEKLKTGGGKIDVGYIYPMAGRFMPHTIRKFLNLEENKHVSFGFHQGDTPTIIKKVKAGEIDVGFGGKMRDERLEFFPLFINRMVLITPKDHELANLEAVKFDVLGKYPVIGYDKKSWLGHFTNDMYTRYNLTPNIICECPDEHSIAALVRESFGIAMVPRLEVIDKSKVSVIPFEDVELSYTIHMFWEKGRYQVPATSRFIDFMKDLKDHIKI